MQRGKKATQVPLPTKQLGDEVADVRNVHIVGIQIHSIKGRLYRIPKSVEQLDAIPRPVLRKVGLITTQQIHSFSHINRC